MGEKDPSRRASDDTRQRIDDLAGGWDLPGRTPAEEPPKPKPPAPPPPRTKGPTRPPPSPPPTPSPPAPPAASGATAPPPAPPGSAARAQRPSAPPPTPPAPVVIGHESFDDPRDDATRIDPAPPTHTAAGSQAKAAPATLRAPATFRRRPGWSGDVAYVFTVLFGGASARRELARVEEAIEQGRLLCEQRLIALGADGIGEPSLDDEHLTRARDDLAAIEEDRSAKAGQAAAADADVVAIERNQKGEIEKQTLEAKAIEAELAGIAERLAPLEKDHAALRKRGAELRATFARIDDQIRQVEGKAAAARGDKADRAGVEAELATLRADRAAVARDEPALAAQQDQLEPRIAALRAERHRASRRLADARAAIIAAGERAADELHAVKAQRKVIDRGLGELEKRRDRALGRLGEHLAAERPPGLSTPLAALDEAEDACAADERRAAALREMLASVDRAAVARGVAILVAIAALLGGFGWFLATR